MNRKLASIVVLALLLVCALGSQTSEMADDKESARQTAAGADDNANRLEGRQEALKKLQDAARIFSDTGEPVEAARTLNRAGRMQIKLNTPQAALDSYEEALSLLKAAPSTEVEVDSLNGIAAAHLVMKNMDQVADALKRSLILCEQSGYTLGQAQALLTLSELQNYSNHAVALDTAHKALALWQTVNDKAGVARTYSQVAQCLMAQHQLPEATTTYQTALQLWRDLNNPSEQAGVLIMLGFIDERNGDWPASIAYFTEAQRLIDERAEPRKMGQISAGLGDAFNENGLPQNGLVHYQSALAYYRLTQNPRSVRSATLGIGRTYCLLQDYPQALTHFQEALKGMDPEGLDATEVYEYFGRIHSATGDYATALQYLEKALAILNRTANPREAARTRALLGQIYQQQGKLDRAREYYGQALDTFRSLTDRIAQAAVYYALGRLELSAGNLEAAEDSLRKSIDVTENMREVPTSTDLTAAFSATVHERYESFIECLMRKHRELPEQGFSARALETNESARARSLVELLRATGTNPVAGVDVKLAEQEKSLRQTIRVKEDERISLLAGVYKKEDLEALQADLARLEAQYKQVDETIRARNPAYSEITRPVALTLRQIQNQVIADDQTMLLEYSLGTEASYVWAVTHTGISSFRLPPRAEIEKVAKRYYELLTANQPRPGEMSEMRLARAREAESELAAETATLSKLLLAPVADKLVTKRLLIVADGALQYIPFQVLSVAGKGSPNESSLGYANEPRPLILDHEIVNEPSASALALMMSESGSRQTSTRSVAILADPVFDSDDSRIKSTKPGLMQATVTALPTTDLTRAFRDVGVDGGQIPRLLSSREEADAIMSVVPWRTGFKAVDFDASRNMVLGSDLGQYRIVHFATHALLNNEHPELSGIVLSLVDQKGERQDGFLRLHDIYNLKLPVDLVVLSACQTGLGKDVKGEGLIGLTRGFMYAGASGVVASLWKVDDEATAELMKHFYTGLFDKGLSPAAALREAQLAMRQQKRWQEPYYWAGFVIQGQYLSKTNRGFQWTPAMKVSVVAGLVGILLAAGFIAVRRRRRRNL